MTELVQIYLWLLLAAGIGFVAGWLVLKLYRNRQIQLLRHALASERRRNPGPADPALVDERDVLRVKLRRAEERLLDQAKLIENMQAGPASALVSADRPPADPPVILAEQLAQLENRASQAELERDALRAQREHLLEGDRRARESIARLNAEVADAGRQRLQLEANLADVQGRLAEAAARSAVARPPDPGHEQQNTALRYELASLREDFDTQRLRAIEFEGAAESAQKAYAQAQEHLMQERHQAQENALRLGELGERLRADLVQALGRAQALERDLVQRDARIQELENRSRDLAALYAELRQARLRLAELEPIATVAGERQHQLEVLRLQLTELRQRRQAAATDRLARTQEAMAAQEAASAERLQQCQDQAAVLNARIKELEAQGTALAARAAAADLLRAKLQAQSPIAAPLPAGPAGVVRIPEETDQADDLKKIHGIGPVLERLLNSIGVTHFRQIARWTPEDVERIDSQLKQFRGRIVRDHWVDGAREMHVRKYGEQP